MIEERKEVHFASACPSCGRKMYVWLSAWQRNRSKRKKKLFHPGLELLDAGMDCDYRKHGISLASESHKDNKVG